jgi:two-component system, NtrC family, response regulator HydG
MTENLHILIVDDDDQMTHTLADILVLKGYTPVVVASGAAALDQIGQFPFACVLTDIRMPGMDGVALFLEIHKRQPDLPVLLMTAYASETLVQQGLDAGAAGILEKPLDISQLLSFFACLKKETTITVVDDDPAFCQTIGDILELRGYKVHKITNPHIAVDEMVGQSQVLLLDMKLNTINGCDLLRSVRLRYPALPVVLITGYRQEMAVAIRGALEVNAYACLYKPLVIPDLLQTLSEIHTQHIKSILEKP